LTTGIFYLSPFEDFCGGGDSVVTIFLVGMNLKAQPIAIAISKRMQMKSV
jgi:hypothetical protein